VLVLSAGWPAEGRAQNVALLEQAERLADRGEAREARQKLASWESEFGASAPLEERSRAWFLAARLAEDGPTAELLYLRVMIEGSGTSYADDALLRLGQYRYAQEDYGKVVEYMGRLRRDYPTSEYGAEALLWIARASRALGDGERACAAAEQGLQELAPADSTLEATLRVEAAECRVAVRAYTVQVAALRDEAAAQRLARDLLAQGYDAWVLNATPGDPLYRVRVGRGLIEAEAQDLVARLTRLGYSPFLVSQTGRSGGER
jgi:tetratricopeptide (TPR) repeat protein